MKKQKVYTALRFPKAIGMSLETNKFHFTLDGPVRVVSVGHLPYSTFLVFENLEEEQPATKAPEPCVEAAIPTPGNNVCAQCYQKECSCYVTLHQNPLPRARVFYKGGLHGLRLWCPGCHYEFFPSDAQKTYNENGDCFVSCPRCP